MANRCGENAQTVNGFCVANDSERAADRQKARRTSGVNRSRSAIADSAAAQDLSVASANDVFASFGGSTIRVGIYARVSTANNQDPETQLTELREHAARRGWITVDEYIDQGVSGSAESRPALNRLMSDACRRRLDVILVWKIDRFGRSLKHLVNSLAELAALGLLLLVCVTTLT